jgi:Conserved protein/domain typically associated with flavoprotein oxygenases, DIM6/NTAB family
MPRPTVSSTCSARIRRSACSRSTRADGRVKDTLVNIQRSNEFVVNLTDEPLARAMHDSSGDFPPDVGEPDYLGLKLAPSTRVAVPRLADAPWAMECKTWKTIDVNGDRTLIMGEGINFYIRDELWDPEPCACTWSAIIRSAACSPTAIAAPTTAWCFRRAGGAGEVASPTPAPAGAREGRPDLADRQRDPFFRLLPRNMLTSAFGASIADSMATA